MRKIWLPFSDQFGWTIHKCCALGLVLLCAVLVTVPTVNAENDFHGDELPPGATTRIGSVKATSELPAEFFSPGSVRVVALSPDGKLLASAAEPSDPTSEPRLILLWEIATGKLLQKFEGHDHPVRSLLFASRGELLISTSEDTLGSGQTRFWNISTGKSEQLIHTGGRDLQLLPESNSVAVAVFSQYQVLHFDLKTGQEVRRSPRLKGPVSISPNLKSVISVDSLRDSRLWLFDLNTGKELAELQTCLKKSGGCFTIKPPDASITISPDGRTIAATDVENRVLVWELLTGELIHALEGHQKKISTLQFSVDGRYLVSGSYDKTVKIWELATGKEAKTFNGHRGPITRLAVSPDGSRIASGSIDRTILLWDFPKGRRSFLPTELPDENARTELWHQLSLTQPTSAYLAMGTMMAHAKTLLPFLQKEVHHILVPAENERIQDLLKQLDDSSDVIRYRATVELRKLRPIAQDLLKKVIKETNSAEVRYRIRRILSGSKDTPRYSEGDIRRMKRLIYTLEAIGGKESIEILKLIIQHFPNPDVVDQAKAALKLIDKAA